MYQGDLQTKIAQVGVMVTVVGLCLILMITSDVSIKPDTPRPGAVIVFYGDSGPSSETSDLEELHAYQERAVIAQRLQSSFRLNPIRASHFSGWIQQASHQTGVPTEILVALIATESSFRYRAKSHVGAIGPAQVVPKYWEEHCGLDLADPRRNIVCGAKVLALYLKGCDDWVCALKKYNVGPTGYTKAESRRAMERYIRKIQTNLSALGFRLVNGELEWVEMSKGREQIVRI